MNRIERFRKNILLILFLSFFGCIYIGGIDSEAFVFPSSNGKIPILHLENFSCEKIKKVLCSAYYRIEQKGEIVPPQQDFKKLVQLVSPDNSAATVTPPIPAATVTPPTPAATVTPPTPAATVTPSTPAATVTPPTPAATVTPPTSAPPTETGISQRKALYEKLKEKNAKGNGKRLLGIPEGVYLEKD